MSQARRQMGLADPDRSEDQDIVVGLQESGAGELGQQLAIQRDLGSVVPAFQGQGWIKAGLLGAPRLPFVSAYAAQPQ